MDRSSEINGVEPRRLWNHAESLVSAVSTYQAITWMERRSAAETFSPKIRIVAEQGLHYLARIKGISLEQILARKSCNLCIQGHVSYFNTKDM